MFSMLQCIVFCNLGLIDLPFHSWTSSFLSSYLFPKMPYLSIVTNRPISEKKEDELLKILTAKCSEWLGKSEDFVMVRIKAGEKLAFAGTEEPAIYAELFSIGLSSAVVPELSSSICDFIDGFLSVPKDRIYLNFCDVPREFWGWDGRTFA